MSEYLSDRELTPRQRRSVLAGYMTRVLQRDDFIQQPDTVPLFKNHSFWRRHPNRDTVALQIMQGIAQNWRYDRPMLDNRGKLILRRKQLRAVQDPYIEVPQYEFVDLERAEDEESQAQYLRAELLMSDLDISLRQQDIDHATTLRIASACDVDAIPRDPVEKIVHDVYHARPRVELPDDSFVPRMDAPLEQTGGAHKYYVDFGLGLLALHRSLAA